SISQLRQPSIQTGAEARVVNQRCGDGVYCKTAVINFRTASLYVIGRNGKGREECGVGCACFEHAAVELDHVSLRRFGLCESSDRKSAAIEPDESLRGGTVYVVDVETVCAAIQR